MGSPADGKRIAKVKAEMTKPIISLDFDGVIHSYSSGWKGPRTIPDEPVKGALDFIQECLIEDWDVVIHSSRARYFGGISAMKTWLKRHSGNSWYDSPAGNGIENVRFVRWKPPALVTIDDRALTFRGRWPDLSDLKGFKPWNKK